MLENGDGRGSGGHNGFTFVLTNVGKEEIVLLDVVLMTDEMSLFCFIDE